MLGELLTPWHRPEYRIRILSSIWTASVLGLLACHTDAIVSPPISTTTPLNSGAPTRLTVNPDQDYWPAWTQDGRGVLYAFVDQQNPAHRCLGLLPPDGGTRLWQLCDNRAVRADTLSSYTAFALDSTGRLLLVEAVSPPGAFASFPVAIRLQLTDTATPYVRSTLLTLPVTVGHTVVTWLSDIAWTGPNSFLALGQQFTSQSYPSPCSGRFACIDSLFGANGIVIKGTLAGSGATLEPVVGTDSATGYSVVDDGASIAFIRGADGRLFEVALSGGPVDSVATILPGHATLLGLACRSDVCLVAAGSQLMEVSLTDGTIHVVAAAGLIATPILSPISRDVVAQIGGAAGHIASSHHLEWSDLYLYKDVFPTP
ncbi:MAG TPA: hypothetical protein VGM20_12010 [Gemmatimonadales bacterium]|jgi:hypothetical protein